MSAMASQMIGISIVYSTPFVRAQIKENINALHHWPSWVVRGIRRWPVNSPHEGPVTRKMFPFYEVIMWLYAFRHSHLRLGRNKNCSCCISYLSIFTGDPLHSRVACSQPWNVDTHSRAHCSPGARLCEQWGHGCVNSGARLCASVVPGCVESHPWLYDQSKRY